MRPAPCASGMSINCAHICLLRYKHAMSSVPHVFVHYAHIMHAYCYLGHLSSQCFFCTVFFPIKKQCLITTRNSLFSILIKKSKLVRFYRVCTSPSKQCNYKMNSCLIQASVAKHLLFVPLWRFRYVATSLHIYMHT